MLKILVLATLAGTILAQSSGSTAGGSIFLPPCAQNCLGNATAHEGACSSIDARCLCENMNYDNALACCITTNCNDDEQKTAMAFNRQLCTSENVTLPENIGCAQISGASTGAAPNPTANSKTLASGGTPSPTNSPPPAKSSSIGTGAIAGIAVGAFACIACALFALLFILRKRRAKAAAERDAATIKSPTTETQVGDPFANMPNSPHKTEISEVPGSPGFASPNPGDRPMPLSWNTQKPGEQPDTPTQPIGGAELPADVPAPIEMPGSTHMDEHHPAYSPLAQVHNAPRDDDEEEDEEGRDPKRETLNSMHLSELDSPIYSPVGGSTLLPDSPHLRGAHVRGVVQDLERSGSTRTADTGVSAVGGGGGGGGSRGEGESGNASVRSGGSKRVSRDL